MFGKMLGTEKMLREGRSLLCVCVVVDAEPSQKICSSFVGCLPRGHATGVMSAMQGTFGDLTQLGQHRSPTL